MEGQSSLSHVVHSNAIQQKLAFEPLLSITSSTEEKPVICLTNTYVLKKNSCYA